MKISTVQTAAALLMIPVLLPTQSTQAGEMKSMNMPAKPAATAADKAFAASMQTMMKGMNVKPTGNPDKDFVLDDDAAPSGRDRHGEGGVAIRD